MKRFVKYLKSWKQNFSDNPEEEFKLSEGCCLFHDRGELNNFTDTNDDNRPSMK